MNKSLFVVYGVICCLVFLIAFLWGVAFVGDLTPSAPRAGAMPLFQALIVDLGLISLFGLQHSIMARAGFKRWWIRSVPEPIERSTYVLLASLALLLLFWQWRPIGVSTERVVWDVHNSTGRLVLQWLFWLGWLIVLVSTFLIDHFDLFGLRQAYCYLQNKASQVPVFQAKGFYRGVRHPIYLGFIVAFWSTPRMSLGHLFFAVMTTAYILIAIQLEERDLVDAFGSDYVAYRRRTPMIVPRLWPARAPLISGARREIH